MRVIVYGPGGFDPTRPNNNVVEDYEVPDEQPSGPTPAPPTVEDLQAQIVALQSQLDALAAAGA